MVRFTRFTRLNGEQWTYLLFASCLLTLVVLKALFVPPTQDEVTTFFSFVLPGKVGLLSLESANNHWLNTGMAFVLIHLLGDHLFFLRLSGVIAFMFYAWFAWRLTKRVGRTARWAFLVALLCNYTLLEYFALARGYGLSFALLLGHLYYLLEFQRAGLFRHLAWSSILVVLACSANLSLINHGILSLVLLAGLAWRHWHKSFARRGWFLLIPVFFLILFIRLALQLHRQGALYHGYSEGFIETTVSSVLNFMHFALHDPRTLIYIGLTLVVGFFLQTWRIKSGKAVSAFSSPYFLILLVLLGNITLTTGLSEWFGVNYPTGRVALYFVLFTLLCFLMGGTGLDRFHVAWRSLYFVLLLTPAIVFSTDLYRLYRADFSHVEAYGNLPESFFEHVDQYAAQSNTLPIVHGDERFSHAWRFYNYRHGGHLNALLHEMRPAKSDFVITEDSLTDPYALVKSNADSTLFLMHRQSERTSRDSVLSCPEQQVKTSELYHSLFIVPLGNASDQRRFLCRFDVFPENQMQLGLVMSVKDSVGSEKGYLFQKLDGLLRDSGMHVERSWPLPHLKGGEAHVYLYNMDEKPFSLVNLSGSIL